MNDTELTIMLFSIFFGPIFLWFLVIGIKDELRIRKEKHRQQKKLVEALNGKVMVLIEEYGCNPDDYNLPVIVEEIIGLVKADGNGV